VKVMYSDNIFMVVIYSSKVVNLSHLALVWTGAYPYGTVRVSSHILLTKLLTRLKVMYSDNIFMVVIYSSRFVNLSHLCPSLDRRLSLWDYKGKLPYLANRHWTRVKVTYSDKLFMVVIYSSRFASLSHFRPSLERHLPLWDCTIRVSSHILLC